MPNQDTDIKDNSKIVSFDFLKRERDMISSKKMAELLYELSSICKKKKWHRSGVHLYVAAEELENMIAINKNEQQQYTAG